MLTVKPFSRLLLVLILLAGCKKDEPIEISNEVGNDAKLLWTSSTSDGGLTQATLHHHIYDNKLLTTGNKGGNIVQLKNLSDGETVWEWDDFNGVDNWIVHFPYLFEDNIIISYHSNLYSINLKNGTTNWKESQTHYSTGHNNVTGLGNTFYFPAQSLNVSEDSLFTSIYKGDVLTGNVEEFLIPQYTKEHLNIRNELGRVERVMALKGNDGHDKMLIVIEECDEDWTCYEYISLYDLTTEEWDYELVEVAEGDGLTIRGIPIISEGKVYMTINKITACHDLFSGEQIWKRSFNINGGISINGFIISPENNKMIISTNASEEETYGLNLDNGNIMWTTKTTGNNGQTYALNGVVYFTSNGDGMLHALDINTGAYIWKIESPDDNSNSFFRGVLTGMPGENGEKGRIFTSSYLNAFCFEAAR